MWVCHRHQTENQASLNKFKDEELQKHNLEFGLFAAGLSKNKLPSCVSSNVSD